MSYLDEIKDSKYKEFYKDLLEYMFEKFELDSDEAEDWCFELLKWDLDKMDGDIEDGINNGYSLDEQLKICEMVFDRETKFEKETEEARKYLEAVLAKYSERHSKNS